MADAAESDRGNVCQNIHPVLDSICQFPQPRVIYFYHFNVRIMCVCECVCVHVCVCVCVCVQALTIRVI